MQRSLAAATLPCLWVCAQIREGRVEMERLGLIADGLDGSGHIRGRDDVA